MTEKNERATGVNRLAYDTQQAAFAIRNEAATVAVQMGAFPLKETRLPNVDTYLALKQSIGIFETRLKELAEQSGNTRLLAALGETLIEETKRSEPVEEGPIRVIDMNKIDQEGVRY